MALPPPPTGTPMPPPGPISAAGRKGRGVDTGPIIALRRRVAELEEQLRGFVPAPFDPGTQTEEDIKTLPCPYTGKPVELRCVGAHKMWMGIGPFYTTNPMQTKRQLIWTLLQRPGVIPTFTKNAVVALTERERPVPAELLPDSDRRERDSAIQTQVDELVDRNATRLGLLKGGG